MNIVNKLTLRSLKQNKRRTLVTIFGVIISVAMITATASLTVSFLDLLKRNAIENDGLWHVYYPALNNEQQNKLQQHSLVKDVSLSRDRGYAYLEGSQNNYRPYLFVKEFNQVGLDNFPITLKDGRFPQTSTELLISEEILKTSEVDLRIGQQIDLELGIRKGMVNGEEKILGQEFPYMREEAAVLETFTKQSKETYTIVGIMERPKWEGWGAGYTVVTMLDEQAPVVMGEMESYVVMNKVKKSIYRDAEKIAGELGVNPKFIKYNNELLRFYGLSNYDGLQTVMYSLTAIIMVIIIVGSVSLIYNAFAISVSERSRYLGMLSSVGATKRQKRNSVFFEGAIIGVISIPLGFIFGLLGIGITFLFINNMIKEAFGLGQSLVVTVTPETIIIACAVSIMTIFIAAYIPAKRASQVTAIDAIRQATEVKLTGKKVRTNRLVRKLFGIEAEIALKNLKRNKRKYQATVVSLVISIVLFLSVSYFTSSLEKSLSLTQTNLEYDISLSLQEKNKAELLDKIGLISTVTEYSAQREMYFEAEIDQTMISDYIRKNYLDTLGIAEDGKFKYDVSAYMLDERTFAAYAQKIGIKEEEFTDPNKPRAIIVNKIQVQDEVLNKYVETESIKIQTGEKLPILKNDDEEQKASIYQMEVGALTDVLPVGARGRLNNITIVISEQAARSLVSEESFQNMATRVYVNSSDPMKTQYAIEGLSEDNLGIYNYHEGRNRNHQMVMLMSVFTYGFICLITAVSVANILNTISTSITLRKREFAMLKSIGMTPKGFNKMINYESMFYGIKALLYGLPISFLAILGIYKSMGPTFSYAFAPPWLQFAIVVIAVFVIVTAAMMYSISKVKKENIIDSLKQENL